jgi:signal transduction histidine kinase
MQISDEELIYYVTLASFFMPLLLGGILIYFILAYQKRSFLLKAAEAASLIREQEIILEKQNDLQNERTRIAAEMHDELGTGLTAIHYQVHKLLQRYQDEESLQIAKSIKDNAKQLVDSMSDIVWAMENKYDNVSSMIDYFRRFISDICEELAIPYNFESNLDQSILPLSGERRRHILLIVKESLNNAIKYSHATELRFRFELLENTLTIKISEIGSKGFDVNANTSKGNGLKNIQERLTALQGHVNYTKDSDGMHTQYSIPI